MAGQVGNIALITEEDRGSPNCSGGSRELYGHRYISHLGGVDSLPYSWGNSVPRQPQGSDPVPGAGGGIAHGRAVNRLVNARLTVNAAIELSHWTSAGE